MEEKTIKSRTIYQGKVVDLSVEEVILPNGRTTTREVVRHSGSVAIVPVVSDDEILLIQQYRKPVGEIILEIPAGRIEEGESLEECAKRELQEETGYDSFTLKKLTSLYPTPGYCNEVIHIFLAEGLRRGEGSCEEDEFIEQVILSRQEVVERIRKGEIRDSKTIVGVLLYIISVGTTDVTSGQAEIM